MGLYSLGTLNRDMSQDLDFGIIQVTSLYPGASTQEMEVKITNKEGNYYRLVLLDSYY